MFCMSPGSCFAFGRNCRHFVCVSLIFLAHSKASVHCCCWLCCSLPQWKWSKSVQMTFRFCLSSRSMMIPYTFPYDLFADFPSRSRDCRHFVCNSHFSYTIWKERSTYICHLNGYRIDRIGSRPPFASKVIINEWGRCEWSWRKENIERDRISAPNNLENDWIIVLIIFSVCVCA